jgi:MFS family permease
VATIGEGRRWSMLALGVFGQAASAMFVNGTPFLIPILQRQGLSLSQAGLLVAMPMTGLVLALIPWGAVMDRIGERKVLVSGLGLLCVAAVGAAMSGPYVVLGTFLLLGGIAAASTNGASGRVIVGWFPPQRRGFAMGIRQTAQPLGVGLGAITMPTIAAAHGIPAALVVPAVMAGLGALGCLVGVLDPPRPPAAPRSDLRANPYRGDSTLWRIHVVSVLLVVPQLTAWTFALVWLHEDRGWSLAAAGTLVFVTQLLGAAGRIGAGALSDVVGSRLRPLRWVAVAAVVSMAALAITGWFGWWIAVPLLVAASVISVADNGLAFTAIAEIAGPYWSGRGLGIQNTGQNLAGAAIPPVFGALITATGFSAAFLAAALIAAVAIPLVPRDRPPRS